MPTIHPIRLLAGAVLLALLLLTLVEAQAVREVPRSQWRISDLLRPGEKQLTVVDSSEWDFVPPPSGLSLTDALTRSADAIFLFRVDSTEGRLDYAENWVATDVTVTVTDVMIAQENLQLVRGRRLRFTTSGGEARVGDAVVRGKTPRVLPIAVGRMYLTFASATKSGSMLLNAASTYELQPSGKFVRRDRSYPYRDDVDGTPEREAMGIVWDAMMRKR